MIANQRELDSAALPNAELLSQRLWNGDLAFAGDSCGLHLHPKHYAVILASERDRVMAKNDHMRLILDIDDRLIRQALGAGPFETTGAAVEAGLKLLARRALYQNILTWEGKLPWEGDSADGWSAAESSR